MPCYRTGFIWSEESDWYSPKNLVHGVSRSNIKMSNNQPSDDNKTVFCQTCGEWRHPRSSCARDASHETAPSFIIELRREGPSGSEIFSGGGSNPEARKKHAIGKFNPLATGSGVLGTTKAVYYLEHEHKPRDIVEEWLNINREKLNDSEVTSENITRSIGNSQLKESWKEIKNEKELGFLAQPDQGDRYTNQGEQSSKCPYCGETVSQLPNHIQSEH